MKIITENRKARHDYTIEESFEAGIELKGTEVKSMRAGKANLKDSFAIIENGELSFRLAFPARIDFTSVPFNSIPASKLSSMV